MEELYGRLISSTNEEMENNFKNKIGKISVKFNLLFWVKDKKNRFHTSKIKSFSRNETKFIVNTINSTYVFEVNKNIKDFHEINEEIVEIFYPIQ